MIAHVSKELREHWTPLIQPELEETHKLYPGYLREFYQRMYAGEIYGNDYTDYDEEPTCGCYYGWLSGLNKRDAENLADAMRRRLYRVIPVTERRHTTRIESWLMGVNEDTPYTSDKLALLSELIEPFLTLPGEEEIVGEIPIVNRWG